MRLVIQKRKSFQMNKSMKSLMITAAVSGLLGGTAARLNATELASHTDGSTTVSAQSTQTVKAGKVSFRNVQDADKAKHSCKGKNDCKGQGGGPNAGKNDCKGKGGCATDGSKPPQAA